MGPTVHRRHGDRAEAVAAEHLQRAGWTVLARQVRVGPDELDIVALDPGPPSRLVAVEVRSHVTRRFGLPEESVDRRKVGRCYRAVAAMRRRGTLPDGRRLPELPWRIDLIAVDLDPALGNGIGGLALRHLRTLEPP